MSSHAAMNPNGGADNMRRVMKDRPLDTVLTIRLRPNNFCETPRADPHAGCWGEGRLITVPPPIKCCLYFRSQFASIFNSFSE